MSEDYLRRLYLKHFADLQRLNSCTSNEDCDFGTESCDGAYCRCHYLYELNENGKCVQCPGVDEVCTDCCGDPALSCINNICQCAYDAIRSRCIGSQPGGVFITASQIALSVALIMGIIALAMVIYRLCTKPRYMSARALSASRRQEEPLDRSYSNYIRASLTSIQIRVLSSMQDRPPSYWIRSSTSATTTVAVAQPELPPSYDGAVTLDTHLPPPYTEIILSPAGYVNSSFVESETSSIRNVITESSDDKDIVDPDVNSNERRNSA